MKIIEELENKISDEIHDIREYAKMAVAVKAEHPRLLKCCTTFRHRKTLTKPRCTLRW